MLHGQPGWPFKGEHERLGMQADLARAGVPPERVAAVLAVFERPPIRCRVGQTPFRFSSSALEYGLEQPESAFAWPEGKATRVRENPSEIAYEPRRRMGIGTINNVCYPHDAAELECLWNIDAVLAFDVEGHVIIELTLVEPRVNKQRPSMMSAP